MTTTTTPGPCRADCYRRARLDAGLDQEDLAQKVSVSRPLISKWERGKSEPTVSQLVALAEATDAEWLLDVGSLPLRCNSKTPDESTHAAYPAR